MFYVLCYTLYDIYFMLYVICSMLYSICYMLYYACYMLYVRCCMLHVVTLKMNIVFYDTSRKIYTITTTSRPMLPATGSIDCCGWNSCAADLPCTGTSGNATDGSVLLED